VALADYKLVWTRRIYLLPRPDLRALPRSASAFISSINAGPSRGLVKWSKGTAISVSPPHRPSHLFHLHHCLCGGFSMAKRRLIHRSRSNFEHPPEPKFLQTKTGGFMKIGQPTAVGRRVRSAIQVHHRKNGQWALYIKLFRMSLRPCDCSVSVLGVQV
jgi:hypothetical protein